MGAPEFILKLREKIGHDPLWIPAVRGVVFNDDGHVLLGQRSDNGRWALISGMLEPGEHPAPGLVREIFEETAVVVETDAWYPWVWWGRSPSPTAMCATFWISCSAAGTFQV